MFLSDKKAKGKVKQFWRHKEPAGSSYPPRQPLGGSEGDMKYRKNLPFGKECAWCWAPWISFFLNHSYCSTVSWGERWESGMVTPVETLQRGAVISRKSQHTSLTVRLWLGKKARLAGKSPRWSPRFFLRGDKTAVTRFHSMPGLSIVGIRGLGSAQRNSSGVLAPIVSIFNGPPMQALIPVF